jgi:hypothetical protein
MEQDSKAIEYNPTGDGQEQQVSMALDSLGPVVVNSDGTMSRIANWDKMTEAEQRNTMRLIAKRNKIRMNTLQNQESRDA